ncbi:MAG: SMC-Scp complex subunit ScpB [Defluviitaleaceae bacterium]|nr:SMC-Scp complex subunit ScpB [Defluviitaleaceae bacterium]
MPGLISDREKMLEAMLFASPESVPLEKLAEALDCDVPMTRNLLEHMAKTYAENAAGIQLSELDGAYRLCTNPIYYPEVQRLLQRKAHKGFSQSVLETMAIIAFKQPITKGAIEAIRGINSDYSVNKLVECGFVTEMGRLDAPGRPILFGTSEDFLLFYGLKSVDELLAMLGDMTFEADEVDMPGEDVSDEL